MVDARQAGRQSRQQHMAELVGKELFKAAIGNGGGIGQQRDKRLVNESIPACLAQPEPALGRAALFFHQQQPTGLQRLAAQAPRLLVEFQYEGQGAAPGLCRQRPIKRVVGRRPQRRSRSTVPTGRLQSGLFHRRYRSVGQRAGPGQGQ
jgi:hypothetical protein